MTPHMVTLAMGISNVLWVVGKDPELVQEVELFRWVPLYTHSGLWNPAS